MDIWEMTAIIVYKSLWWIVPCILYVISIVYLERK